MKINEKNFVTQLRLHNEKALLYVIDAYGGLLVSIIRKHFYAIPEMEEECLNDVLLKIWQNIESFDESKSSFKNWAAAIATYRSIDYLRIYQKELYRIDIEEVNISQDDSALAHLLEKEISEELELLLGCLNSSDRELFLRLYVEEESVEQISRDTGMEKTVIYNRVSRGKKKIRKNYLAERSK